MNAVGTRLLLQQRDRQPAQQRKVLRTMSEAEPAVILPEAHVQHPVQPVLDPPVAPHPAAVLGGRPGPTADVIPGLRRGRAVRRSLAQDPAMREPASLFRLHRRLR